MKRISLVGSLLIFLVASVCYGQNNVGVSPPGFLTSLPPESPVLISPSDDATDLSESVLLYWHPQINTASYSFQLSKQKDFTSFVADENLTDTTFQVSGLEYTTTYYWRVKASNKAGESEFSAAWQFTTLSSIDAVWNFQSDDGFGLKAAYPNPFQQEINISFQLEENSKIVLTICNVLGQPVRKLASDYLLSGKYTFIWDGCDGTNFQVGKGIYICILKTKERVYTQKIIRE